MYVSVCHALSVHHAVRALDKYHGKSKKCTYKFIIITMIITIIVY
jgi:uncharacterized protein YqhQ